MAQLVYRTIGYDATTDRTYVYATRGKDKLICALAADMTATVVRAVNPPSETVWATPDRIVFWAIDKTVGFRLDDPAAKGKTIKQATFARHARFIGAPAGLFALAGDSIYRFAGDAWTCIDGQSIDGVALVPTLRSLRARPLGGTPADWTELATFDSSRATMSAFGRRCLVSGDHSLLIDADGANRIPVERWFWCSAGHARGFFGWADHRIWQVAHDGAVTDTKIVASAEASDDCLVQAGDTVYFVMDSAIWRHRGGTWSEHAPEI